MSISFIATVMCVGEYLVIASMEHPGSLKFRNMANTLWYLGLVQGAPTMPNQPPPIYLAASVSFKSTASVQMQ